jgi:hypothetical protein
VTLVNRLLREPLVHFMAIGAVIFAVHAYRTGGEQPDASRDRIVVTPGRVAQLAQVFSKTWQRPPTPQELKGLIEAFVKEEVYYREAVKLGLDRDDTLIRRRMQQKMEFLTEPGDEALEATDGELEAFLAANREAFRVEPRVAFDQVFIRPEKVVGAIEPHVAELLQAVRSASSDAEIRQLGHPTMLPSSLRLAPLSQIDRNFGSGFGEQLTRLPKNAWSGPVKSTYGLHLVRVTEKIEGYDPPLAEVRQAVELKWRTAKRDAFRQAEYQRLREKYQVVLPDFEGQAVARGTSR